MAGSTTDPTLSERSPLLPNNEASQVENGAAATNTENGTVSEQQNASDTPIAEEKSSTELLFILGSVWVGVFFAALGMFCSVFESNWI